MTIKGVKNFALEKKLAGLPSRIQIEDRISPVIPKNILRGKVPVASTWDTDPTNLENCTDGDIATVTGTGNKVMGAGGTYGVLVFDLGAVKTVLVSGLVGLWSTAGSASIFITSSLDNITYTTFSNSIVSLTSATELKAGLLSKIVTSRYVKVTFYASAASTAYAKIYELYAHEFGL